MRRNYGRAAAILQSPVSDRYPRPPGRGTDGSPYHECRCVVFRARASAPQCGDRDTQNPSLLPRGDTPESRSPCGLPRTAKQRDRAPKSTVNLRYRSLRFGTGTEPEQSLDDVAMSVQPARWASSTCVIPKASRNARIRCPLVGDLACSVPRVRRMRALFGFRVRWIVARPMCQGIRQSRDSPASPRTERDDRSREVETHCQGQFAQWLTSTPQPSSWNTEKPRPTAKKCDPRAKFRCRARYGSGNGSRQPPRSRRQNATIWPRSIADSASSSSGVRNELGACYTARVSSRRPSAVPHFLDPFRCLQRCVTREH